MNNIYNILVVEDEWISAEFISDSILSLGHNVVGIASSAKEALSIAKSEELDLVFMDINIKGPVDGILLAQEFNKQKSMPIVFLTAFGDSQTIIDASATNIYGFVIKPFTQNDIEAALTVAIARVTREKQTTNSTNLKKLPLDLGHEYLYDFEQDELSFKNRIIPLSQNESKLLALFCLHYGHIVSLSQIHSHVWRDKEVADSTIRDTILRIRKKIPLLEIENTVGVGYTLQKEITIDEIF